MKKGIIWICILCVLCLFGCSKKIERNYHCTVTVDADNLMLSSTALAHDALESLGSAFEAIRDADVTFAEGETVRDVLVRTLQDAKLSYEIDSEGFISSIGGLGNQDAGLFSGWIYTVNGKMPSVSSGEYVLQEGDAVRYFFLIDFTTYKEG